MFGGEGPRTYGVRKLKGQRAPCLVCPRTCKHTPSAHILTPKHAHADTSVIVKPSAAWRGQRLPVGRGLHSSGEAWAAYIFFTLHFLIPTEFCFLGMDYVFKQKLKS